MLKKLRVLFQITGMNALFANINPIFTTIYTSFREKIAQCYDFTLDKVGMDIQSYSIWNDYIHFLRNVEAVGSYAENQRITAVRKVYQRGVITPMLNIEQLWKDYIAYESSINPMIAEKMQQVG